MDAKLLDLDFLYEISEKDPSYIHDVIEIFLSTSPEGLEKLEAMVLEAQDWDAIYKQAHFLKSSFSIVKVADVYDKLAKVEALARYDKEKEKTQIDSLVTDIRKHFDQALPLIMDEFDRTSSN